ncbi:MAG: hypothetical protein RLZ17_130, partial [Actinomycetota bacterium]
MKIKSVTSWSPQQVISALIVGGSRGLGAAFARAICIGGGHATVSYHRGALE